MTPMPAVPKALQGFEKYKLYQVSRQEDGRRRFRLRLGFFTSEADADWVLNSVRNLYPAAFTGCLSQEDVRFAGDVLPAVTAKAPVAALPAQAAASLVTTAHAAPPSVAMAAVKPAAPSSDLPAKTAAAKPLTLVSAEPIKINASHRNEEAGSAEARPYARAFHVARGIELPETNLELTDEFATLAPAKAPPAAAIAANKPATPAASKTANNAATGNGPVYSASIIHPPKVVDDYVPILDTTLTIRTLTKSEADDPNRAKWFVVQLAVSEQPINLQTMPKLDIFAAYSLYCVALMEGGSIRHALRLGFFRENVSADAVMGYLKAFFPTPNVSQISAAEYERFADPKPRAQPTAETETKALHPADKRPVATPASSVVVKTASKPATTAKPIVAKTTAAVRTKASDSKARRAPPARPQSFLSRLIGRQLD